MGEPGWDRVLNSPAPAGLTRSVSGAIGLFLDVGGTLTRMPAQRAYAATLGVTVAYDELERAYESRQIDSQTFGAGLVELFRGAGFTRDFARRFCPGLLRDGVAELLQAPAIVYLVSSGPSYFVRPLAERFGIPQDRVLCSEYEFSVSDGGGIASCEAVTEEAKRDFVASRLRRHLVSIGCGDSAHRDGPFLDLCDLGIMLGSNDHYLSTPDIDTVRSIVERLTCQLTRNPKWGHSRLLPHLRQLEDETETQRLSR
jgi:phosphoserine phosphatase